MFWRCEISRSRLESRFLFRRQFLEAWTLRIGSNIPIEPEQRGRQRDRNESAPARYRGHVPLDQFERGRFFTGAHIGQREEIDAQKPETNLSAGRSISKLSGGYVLAWRSRDSSPNF